MKIKRVFTKKGKGPYDGIVFEKRISEIKSGKGEIIFHTENVVVPSFWSQISTDILAQKYFRKSGVPLETGGTGEENDARQVFHRLAFTWTDWGRRYGYFDTGEDGDAFYDELCHMLAHQMAAPNSPQLFNTGLFAVYGIKGPAQGHYYVDPETKSLKKSESAFERPQPHACFILSVEDTLLNEHGIYDLITTEARLFKYGSGTGSNFSDIRGKGEPLSGGGWSSGLLSFLKIGDRSASAIKSGGTTRRAAKMVIIDADHPDIEEYIDWKVEEEHKVASLVTGSAVIARHSGSIKKACAGFKTDDDDKRYDPRLNAALSLAIENALIDKIPASYVYKIVRLIRQKKDVPVARIYTTDWEDDAYASVSGQSSNNSVRITNRFMQACENGGNWDIRYRTGGSVKKSVMARELFEKIALSAWSCADPAIQFHTTINEWHTCLPDGEIRASNPCSEYMFLDDTACNLASLNLLRFYDKENNSFRIETFGHAVALWTIVLEISVLMAQFPSKDVAQNSFDYRTLGLGIANLGTLLMVMGLPYDSDRARNLASSISAILSGIAYGTSALLAKELGPFSKYESNKQQMLKVIRNHRRAAYDSPVSEYEDLTIKPEPINPELTPEPLLKAARKAWDDALALGEKYGYRNAQVTAIAPTGTIGLLMDCDTTGIEPDFALVKYKKLAGGGVLRIINSSIEPALVKLGYSKEQIGEIVRYAVGSKTLANAPSGFIAGLKKAGFTDELIEEIDKKIADSVSIDQVFNSFDTRLDPIKRNLSIPETESLSGSELLKRIGFPQEEIASLSIHLFGTGSIEDAPHLKPEHFAVFDTANISGDKGTRVLHWKAHVRMMAAVQPFITGAISKTINMPEETTIEEVGKVFLLSWKLMLKSISIFRDGCKLSQPLSGIGDSRTPLSRSIASIMKSVRDRSGEKDDVHKTLPEKNDEKNEESIPACGRTPLPHRRSGYTQKAKIGGHSIFLRTGEYKNGTLGEIFLDMYKEGAAFRSLLNSFAIAVSLGLQYGVPLEELVEAFTFTRFEPNGIVQDHNYIKMATSVIDFVFRDLALNYLKRTDLVQVKPDDLISTATMDSHSDNGGNTDDADSDFTAARKKGYEGNPCPSCGNFTLVRSGTCFKCDTCGSTTGCS